jgi:hypothetical protein
MTRRCSNICCMSVILSAVLLSWLVLALAVDVEADWAAVAGVGTLSATAAGVSAAGGAVSLAEV